MFALMTTQRAIGYVVITIVFVGGFFFVWTQIRKGRKEVGSEVELAPNRKPYLDDAELETKKLNVALFSAFGLLIVIVVTLPLYWLAEAGRESGAVKDYQNTFIIRGEEIYKNGAKCEGCHGPLGVGGQASYVITDENGQFVSQVNWNAPALNTVLWRFSQSEVRDILNYGRPGSPMQPWGTIGGGALSDQQVSNVIDYLWSFQLTNAQMTAEIDKVIKDRAPQLYERLAAVRTENAQKLKDPLAYNCSSTAYACLTEQENLQLGEILFNLTDVASGAYSCARCHVPGASYGKPWQPIESIGRGRYGPNLIGSETNFTITQQYQLVMKGTENGKLYGANQQGDGRMPGFGTNANYGDPKTPQGFQGQGGGMYGPEEVYAIVVYERNLSKERPDLKITPIPPRAPAVAGAAAAGATTSTTVPTAASGSTR